MKIKAMYSFKGIADFNRFSEFLEKEQWKIEKQLLKERAEKYKEKEWFVELSQTFKNKNISIWELRKEEVITWLDTMLIMRRLMFELYKKGIKAEGIDIFMEYPLVYGNHMRTDYLIIYERLIVVVEFGMFNQDEKRSEERYTKKLQESINYRQIIGNLVSDKISVINYAMIYRPEYNRTTKKTMEGNIAHNSAEIKLLSKFLRHNIHIQDSLSAIKQLEHIESSKNR